VNGIVFLYSFSSGSLLVYTKATDFYKLILYSATLLKLFMVSRSFWVEVEKNFSSRWNKIAMNSLEIYSIC
jgi:hypothetical protein